MLSEARARRFMVIVAVTAAIALAYCLVNGQAYP